MGPPSGNAKLSLLNSVQRLWVFRAQFGLRFPGAEMLTPFGKQTELRGNPAFSHRISVARNCPRKVGGGSSL